MSTGLDRRIIYKLGVAVDKRLNALWWAGWAIKDRSYTRDTDCSVRGLKWEERLSTHIMLHMY